MGTRGRSIAAVVSLAFAGCGSPAEGPSGPGPSASGIVEEWMYKGKATMGLTVSPTGSSSLASTFRGEAEGSFEEAWEFYARKCGSDLTYSAGAKRLIGGEKDGDFYTICDIDASAPPGRRATSFARRAKGSIVSVTLIEGAEQTLGLSVTVGLR